MVSQVQQEGIIKEFVPSNAGGSSGAQFGLVGALIGAAVNTSINNSRAKEAETTAEPFRNALLDINTRETLKLAYTDALKDIDWATHQEVLSEQLPENSKTSDYTDNINDDLLLLISTRYSLKPNAEVIEFKADYSTFEKKKKVTIRVRKNSFIRIRLFFSHSLTMDQYAD